jgi:hypothetical protein
MLKEKLMTVENNNNLTLAITKVGDLLLKKEITQDQHGKVIQHISLKIPDYQRPYKWTSKNVIQLLNDIIAAKNANKKIYRVGTLILHYEDDNNYNIVDGQQRTITFSLLLRALAKSQEISFLNESLSSNLHNRRNIPNNYRTLERRIQGISVDKEKDDLFNYVKNNCELIVVITKDISEAFQFFDSQNSRGKKLYPHDLLKAYHLREMNTLDITETEKVVNVWEELDQKDLAKLFSDYLYRIKDWINGNKAWELNEHTIHNFKGITQQDNFPYAQFYKGAFAYAESVNHSFMPFVTGARKLKPFQLDTPIVAGKPFFDYAKYYYETLRDIQNNDKYEGYFINDNEIVKTLELPKFKNGVGNQITRLLFDTIILLYVDRFCPLQPTKIDLDMLDQFVVFAFVWAYSLRAQYIKLGWQSAQNYILGNDVKKLTNSFNIYRVVSEAESPIVLLSNLSDQVMPLQRESIKVNNEGMEIDKDSGIAQNYLYYFKKNNFLIGVDNEK